ncbi:MAG TPA: type I restriction enzyme HsdR N-terminal domain-containing protein [Candidatus Omnitrophota bacterium]|nr:type I restriction enzyme HsdR N-terminal domain-containing protein [Candidatus Omnitrophota bacterium]
MRPDLLSRILITEKGSGACSICSKYFTSERVATPEEVVRQLFLVKLVLHYNYDPISVITEYPIQIGITKKRADIVVLSDKRTPLIIAEIKIKADKDTEHQLVSYLAVARALFGVVVSETEIKFFRYNADGSLSRITDIPVKVSGDASYIVQDEEADVNTFGITKLMKKSNNTSILIINGHEIEIRNNKIMKYSNIQKSALNKGIVLSHSPEQGEWHRALEHLFLNAEDVLPSSCKTESLQSDEDTVNAVNTFGIVKLLRQDKNTSVLVINDSQITIKNNKLIKYINIQKCALNSGIVLSHYPTQKQWNIALEYLFSHAEDVQGPPDAFDSWKDSIEKYLIGKAKVRSIDIWTECLKGFSSDFDRGRQRRVADCMMRLGWIKKKIRVNDKTCNGYINPKSHDQYETTSERPWDEEENTLLGQ